MLWNKTSCMHCTKNQECPDKTKMNINYCGSHRLQNSVNIREAVADCLERRGLNYIRITVNATWAGVAEPAAA